MKRLLLLPILFLALITVSCSDDDNDAPKTPKKSETEKKEIVVHTGIELEIEGNIV